MLTSPDRPRENREQKFCCRNVIGLNSTEIGRRDVRNRRVTDSQRYKRPRRLLAAVVELMRAGQIKFKTRLERACCLEEAQGVCKLLERTHRSPPGSPYKAS